MSFYITFVGGHFLRPLLIAQLAYREFRMFLSFFHETSQLRLV